MAIIGIVTILASIDGVTGSTSLTVLDAPPITYLDAPVISATAVGYDAVKVTWAAVTNATSYDVYSTYPDGTSFKVGNTASLSYTQSTTNYYSAITYHVVACLVNSEGALILSDPSNAASATPIAAPPPAPLNFQSRGGGQLLDGNGDQVIVNGTGAFQMTFTPPSNAAAAHVTGYRMYVSDQAVMNNTTGTWDPVTWNDNHYVDGIGSPLIYSGLVPGHYYYAAYCLIDNGGPYMVGPSASGGVIWNANKDATATGGSFDIAWQTVKPAVVLSQSHAANGDTASVTFGPAVNTAESGVASYNIYYTWTISPENKSNGNWVYASALDISGGTVTINGCVGHSYLTVYCVAVRTTGTESTYLGFAGSGSTVGTAYFSLSSNY